MGTKVVVDADFLSAFLKISRCELVRRFFRVETITIAPAVYREIASSMLLQSLAVLSWIQIEAPPAASLGVLNSQQEFGQLGAGEQESIALSLGQSNALLLSNDNRARRYATVQGVNVLNIPGFLLACKQAGELDSDSMRAIIDDLARLDFYRFRQDQQRALLA